MTAGRKPGSVKTGGRQKGSLDKNARVLVSNELGHSIMQTFEKTGGVAGMVRWVQENNANRTAFYTQILSRMMPAPQKDSDGDTFNQQINIGQMSDFEAGRRVAFALAMGIAAQQELAPVAERVPGTPQEACEVPDWQPPTYTPGPTPEPVMDPDRQRWVEELPMTPEERRNAALVRETQEVNINNYRGGSPAEQGGGYQQPVVQTKLSAGELARRLNRRGRDLL